MQLPHSLFLSLALFCSLGLTKHATCAESTVTIDLVTVDAPHNPADSRTGLGAVEDSYQIGTFDVTAGQYAAFLNAVASIDDSYGLFNSEMCLDLYVHEITQYGSPGNYYYVVTPGKENFPMACVSWYHALRFCNWMENGQPCGKQDATTTEDGSYRITKGEVTQRARGHWFLPTENEWYKAAYYNKVNPTHYWTYSTQSDLPPGNSAAAEDNQPDSPNKNANYYLQGQPTVWQTAGVPETWEEKGFPDLTPVGIFKNSPGPFGTYDMGGNVYQWTTGSSIYPHSKLMFSARGGSRYTGMPYWGEHQTIDYRSKGGSEPQYPRCDLGFRLVYKTHGLEQQLIPQQKTISYERTWEEWFLSWF